MCKMTTPHPREGSTWLRLSFVFYSTVRQPLEGRFHGALWGGSLFLRNSVSSLGTKVRDSFQLVPNNFMNRKGNRRGSFCCSLRDNNFAVLSETLILYYIVSVQVFIFLFKYDGGSFKKGGRKSCLGDWELNLGLLGHS